MGQSIIFFWRRYKVYKQSILPDFYHIPEAPRLSIKKKNMLRTINY